VLRLLIYSVLCFIFLFSQGCKGCGDEDNKETAVKPTFEYDVQKKDEKAEAKKEESEPDVSKEEDDLIWEDDLDQTSEPEKSTQEKTKVQENGQTPQSQETTEESLHPSEESTTESTTGHPEQTPTQTDEAIESDTETVSEPSEEDTEAPQEQRQDVPKAKQETVVASKEPVEKSKERVSRPAKVGEYKPSFSEKGSYVVQVASFKEKRNAVNLVSKLKSQGYPVYVDFRETDKGALYGVRIGNFNSKSAAEEFRQKILLVHGDEYKSSWVDKRK
jgi:cell division septation protein DedD